MRLAVVFAVSFCAACATVRAQERDDSTRPEQDEPAPAPEVIEGDGWAPYPEPSEISPRPASVGERIAAHASALVGLPRLTGYAPGLPDDCTGLVRLVYRHEGIELMTWVGGRGLNGVTIMFRAAQARGALHAGTPSPGDLAFFRETYDRDRDGRRDDGYTHVAVVESVATDGTVTYVHRSGSGVTRARMNLSQPRRRSDDAREIINDYLRPATRRAPAAFAAELFVGYASAYALASTEPGLAQK